MTNYQINQRLDVEEQSQSLQDLREKWAELWGIKPHFRIGRALLERSLEFKIRERAGHGLTEAQHARLDQLIRAYKRNPLCFEESDVGIKPGTKLVKIWNDERHIVTILPAGFEYRGAVYNSLSTVAYKITGTRWNGWVFFHLKKRKPSK